LLALYVFAFAEGEIEEMIDLYIQKGVSEHDARVIINTLAKYPEAFLVRPRCARAEARAAPI
jgi:hypothetical protein